jgi:hypothetical protein
LADTTKNPLLNLDPAVQMDRDALFRYVLTPIKILMETRKLPAPKINPYLLLDAIVHAKRDLSFFTGPDAFKMGGHIGFWIARLKPFRMMETSHIKTNETLGLQLALAIVAESMGQKKVHYKILQNLLHDLRYGMATPMAFTNQLQMLYAHEYSLKYP